MAGLDSTAPLRPTAERPLNAILEEPDENKSVATDGGGFFSDDDDEDSVSFPKFTPLVSGPAKITFANSSFNNRIKQNPLSVLQPENAAAPSQTVLSDGHVQRALDLDLLGFDSDGNKEMPLSTRKMSRVPVSSDSDVLSPASDNENVPEDPFGFLSSFQDKSADYVEANAATAVANSDGNVHSSGYNVHFANFEDISIGPLPTRKLIIPDEPVSTSHIDFGEAVLLDTGPGVSELHAELAAARQEISNLVAAIHQKDQSVIDAHRKIEELQEDAVSEKRDGVSLSKRLDTALTNASQLEAKNVLLRTQLDELEQENQSVGKSLRDIAVLLHMQSIPADDKTLGIHVKAKVSSLLKAEAELLHLKAQKDDLDYSESNLMEDLANARAALTTEKMLRSQAELLIVRNAEIKKSDILSMESKLHDAEKKLLDQEELSHAVAAEARALSEELKDTHKIIERKDKELQELRARAGSGDHPGDFSSGLDPDQLEVYFPQGSNDTLAENTRLLEAENESLKEELSSLRRKIIHDRSQDDSPKNLTDRQSLLRTSTSAKRIQPPEFPIISDQTNGNQTGKVKRELKVLNAALSQVISASNSTTAKLQTENLALVGRLREYDQNEALLRSDLYAQNQHIAQLKGRITALETATEFPAKPTEPAFQPSLEWTETTLRTLLQQLRDMVSLTDLKADSVIQSDSERHRQIAMLADALQRVQADVQRQGAALAATQNVVNVKMETASQARVAEVEATLESQRTDITVLRKMIGEREDEIEHWRTVCAKLETSAVIERNLTDAAGSGRLQYDFDGPPANQRFWNATTSEYATAGWLLTNDRQSVPEHNPALSAPTTDQTAVSRYRSATVSGSPPGVGVVPVYYTSDTSDQFAVRSSDVNDAFFGKPDDEGHEPRRTDEDYQNKSPDKVGKRPNSAPDSKSLPERVIFDAASTTERGYPEVIRNAADKQPYASRHIVMPPRDFILRDHNTSVQAPKLILPSIDYESIRLRSRNQVAQLEDLCKRIDRANAESAILLPSHDHNVDFSMS